MFTSAKAGAGLAPRTRAGSARGQRAGGAGSATRMFALFISTMRAPMPLTRISASGVAKLPFALRSATIASASAARPL